MSQYCRLSLTLSASLLLSLGLAACGDDTGGGADGGYTSVCSGFEDRYLPYQPGYKWTYRVTDLAMPAATTKSQELKMETDPMLGEVIIQTTTKGTGTTISSLKREEDAIVRYRQEDHDQLGALERTSVYAPGQRRLDESAAKITVGAQWDDVYEVTVTDLMGVVTTNSRTDHWKVLGIDVACNSPLGDFKCLHLRRQRIAGGLSDKQFFFAKGVGKVKEVNANQIEELVSCGM